MTTFRSALDDQLQGYLWGRPQPAECIPQLMLAQMANLSVEGALSRGAASLQAHLH